MKRVLGIVFALALAASLTACAAGASAGNATQPGKLQATAVTEPQTSQNASVFTQQSTTVRAWVSDPNPRQGTDETVYGQIAVNGAGVSGAPVHFWWNYRTVTHEDSFTTNSQGVALDTRFISDATPGYPVAVDLGFDYQGQTYWTATSFTPRPG